MPRKSDTILDEDNNNEAVENEEEVVNLLDREPTDLEVFEESGTLEAQKVLFKIIFAYVGFTITTRIFAYDHLCILILIS
mmetsp:Transcript_17286/g.26187  ORF Transcript_17286/g.26187 Transcript_17286/m.26187 type:complete len:80 (+) Transcript_17286:1420-1659(+)